MIKTKPIPTLSAQAKSRVRAWLAATDMTRTQITNASKVNEKTIRLALKGTWNPTADTLSRLEMLIPSDWQQGRR